MVIFLASAGFLGYVPIAPGTFGTLAGIILYLGLGRLPFWPYLIALAAFIAAAIILAARAERLYGQRDDGRIVIDEVAGYLVTMAGVKLSLTGVVLGFILFRAFDILKPWPVRAIDRKWPGGFGLVLDDVGAGIYACAVLHLLILLWSVLGGPSW
ncbi:MAG: phosphatidylglycerophosphatase A [Deltaproteobacteria bacterium]|nr:phosphatidylglycerophosphatase A [Deltaproteobacteria bacterium]